MFRPDYSEADTSLTVLDRNKMFFIARSLRFESVEQCNRLSFSSFLDYRDYMAINKMKFRNGLTIIVLLLIALSSMVQV